MKSHRLGTKNVTRLILPKDPSSKAAPEEGDTTSRMEVGLHAPEGQLPPLQPTTHLAAHQGSFVAEDGRSGSFGKSFGNAMASASNAAAQAKVKAEAGAKTAKVKAE